MLTLFVWKLVTFHKVVDYSAGCALFDLSTAKKVNIDFHSILFAYGASRRTRRA